MNTDRMGIENAAWSIHTCRLDAISRVYKLFGDVKHFRYAKLHMLTLRLLNAVMARSFTAIKQKFLWFTHFARFANQ